MLELKSIFIRTLFDYVHFLHIFLHFLNAFYMIHNFKFTLYDDNILFLFDKQL